MALVAVLAAGCAAGSGKVYTPDEIRRILQETPGLPSGEVVVLHELPRDVLDEGRAVALKADHPAHKIDLLVDWMSDPAGPGIAYDGSRTTTGAETLLHRRGNCVGFAAVFVGLARAAGLDARYVDVSVLQHQRRYGEDGGAVDVGHVSAAVNLSKHRIGLDFARAGPDAHYKVIDDLEALAHYYNNRGYEPIEAAREAGRAPDWEAAARQFRYAVAVKPTFARAWNNLGVAEARLGRRADAMEHYRQAASLDPKLAAPRANLGAALLQAGEVPDALAELERAAKLDPDGANIQYHLALARLRSGDRPGALKALRRTLDLHAGYPGAREMYDRLSVGEAARGG